MDTFLRAISLLLLGIFIGAAGMLFFTPSFNVVVSRHPGAMKLIELTDTPTTAAVPDNVKPVAPVVVATPAVIPAKSVVVAEAKPVAAAPATPAAAEPAIDFKAISEYLVLWPTAVAVKTATTVPVIVDGKKVQDLALEVGTVLQVSKVLADGSIEVRAKGAKFEIKSTFTDFSVELGKRVSELVAKGVKVDAAFAANSSAMTPVAPVDATLSPVAPVVAVIPKGPLTLAQRVDVLFGVKPDDLMPAAPVIVTPTPAVVAPAPAAPVVEVAPVAPAADAKGVEKGKDLDRKMNQLFK